jgi:hypothetical protein
MEPVTNADFENAIKKNRFLLDNELKQARAFIKAGRTAEALIILTDVARFAWFNYTGYHASAKLESSLLQISKQVVPYNPRYLKESTGIQKVLHVTTFIYETGGHTPLMLKWIQRDSVLREHDVFITLQPSVQMPVKQFEKHNFNKERVIFWRDKNESFTDIATLLQQKSQEYDLVVLHTHPDDIIPVLAFANYKSTPVYLLNHADHSFWLGASVLDGLVQIREINYDVDAIRRGIPKEKQFYLPIPVDDIPVQTSDRNKIAAKLGIENFETILLSTSSENKFVFFKDYNYFESIIPVLEQNPQAVLLLVGVRPESWMGKKYQHSQIKFLGIRMPSELAEIESITDIYVENLPYSSFTALLQVFMKKTAIHFVYSPLNITQLINDKSIYTADIKQWQERLHRLINDADYRKTLADGIYASHNSDYTLAVWQEKLNIIYNSAISVKTEYNVLPQEPIKTITDNEILLYKLFSERYQHHLFPKTGMLFIKRLLNFIFLKSKGFNIKKKF